MRNEQSVVRDFFSIQSWDRPYAITLTMRKIPKGADFSAAPVTVPSLHTASKNFRHFLNVLNRKFYRSAALRGLRGVKVLPVIEQNADGRFHYHAVIDRPAHISEEEFGSVIAQAWRATDWGHQQIDIKPNADDRWINYITKRATKANLLDFIDWENVRRS